MVPAQLGAAWPQCSRRLPFLMLLKMILGEFFCFLNRRFLLYFVPNLQALLAAQSHHVKALAWELRVGPKLSTFGNKRPVGRCQGHEN